MNQFETKQTFIKKTLSEWKKFTPEDREQFLISPAPENLKRRSIKFYFSTVSQTASKETKEVENPVPESAPFSGTSVHTENAITTFHDRSAFLIDKEILLVKKTMNEMEFLDPSNFFTDGIKSNQKFQDLLKTFSYTWEKFYTLELQCVGGKTVERNSALKLELDCILSHVNKVKALFEEVSSYKVMGKMTAMNLSQTFLKKCEAVFRLIYLLCKLKDKISDSELLSKLRRRITQQNAVTNKLFIRNNEELIQYFCENNTRLMWDIFLNNLINHFNSNTDLGSFCIEELMMVTEEIRRSIFLDTTELQKDETLEKVRRVINPF